MAVNNLLTRDDEGGGDDMSSVGPNSFVAHGNLEEWDDEIPEDLVPYIESAERAAESGYIIANHPDQEVSGSGAGGHQIADDFFSYSGPHGTGDLRTVDLRTSGRPRWGRISAAPNIDDAGKNAVFFVAISKTMIFIFFYRKFHQIEPIESNGT